MTIPASSLSRFTRLSLALSYAKPLAWHAPAGLLFALRLQPVEAVTPELLGAAEQDSYFAVRFLWAELVAVLVAIALMMPLSLALWFVTGLLVIAATGGIPPAWIGVAAALVVAAAFFSVIYTLGRKAARFSMSGIAIALRLREVGELPDLTAYPRMQYALNRLIAQPDGGA